MLVVSLNNFTPNCVAANKENRRKDAGGVNVQDQAIVTKNTVEVKVEDLMIGLNSMIDDNQEIDLSLRRLENISIVKKVIM